jgi:NTE family protein
VSAPRIGLALGGGGARGLAHIAILEAFDELGVRPAAMIGCSAGALVGAPYAAGISTKDLRAHAESLLGRRADMLKRVLSNGKPLSLLKFGGFNSLHLSAQTLVEIAMPAGVPELIEDLIIPMQVVATNYKTMQEHVISSGPLVPAVAASIAIPGVISGGMIDGALHVDGGVTNPVPFNHLFGRVDKVIAVDVTGRPRVDNARPSNFEVAIGSLLIMFHQIAGLRREKNPPDVYIEVDTSGIGSADFFRLPDILAAAAPAKDRMKREIESLC